MRNNIKLSWICIFFVTHINMASAVLPPASLGTIPFDHDKFLQFAESNITDTVASGDAYYATIDPDNLRTTIADWKALNGFIEPLPSATLDLAAMGISHTLYRNATDLGFIRNIYIRTNANGDIVALLENFPSFERTIDFSADEIANGCSDAFNPALPKEQRCTSGGVDGFENRDLSGVLASVVMEYSAVTAGGPKFTQFYGYGNDGNRVSALDLTGRGKAEAFPGLCAVCHGGKPGGIDEAGQFIPPDMAYAGATEGNIGAGFLPFDPDLYEFHDPLSAGSDVGSGAYSRANQEAFYKELNSFVLDTDPTPAARELVEGWYGGAGLPNSFNGLYMPAGWANSVEDAEFYEKVIAPYCRACHIQRAFPESETNINVVFQDSRMDFSKANDLIGLRNQISATVFSRTTMPLALVTYDKFWSDTVAVQTFIDYMAAAYPEHIPTEDDGSGNLVAVVPGKPIAIPGAYVNQVAGIPFTLDGSESLSADIFIWSVSPTNGVTLSNATTATPTFVASIPGTYTLTLTVENNAVVENSVVVRPADISVPVSTSFNVVDSGFARITFDSSIKSSPTNARCSKCHSRPDIAGSALFDIYDGMTRKTRLTRFASIQGDFSSRLLFKPAGLLGDNIVFAGVHQGGKIIQEDGEYYSLLKNWIEDGECKNETDCQRISVTNENTAIEIDPLSPFMDKSHLVSLSEITPVNGTLSLTPDKQLLYIPDTDFTGLDTYHYLLTNKLTGTTWLVIDKIYVFPDFGIIPPDLTKTFSSQYSIEIPSLGSPFVFEKVNTDSDALPNYLDDYPNNALISRDYDGDGLPDAFNLNVTSEQALASGIIIDLDDDGDGIDDVIDPFPLDPFASDDGDKDGVVDSSDNCPVNKNTNQSDVDNDGIGDACDISDTDGDGISDADEFAQGSNPASTDTDADGSNDSADAYPTDPSASSDSDGDGQPDTLVPGVASTSVPPLSADLQPSDPRAGLDTDGDGVGDNAIYAVAGTGIQGFSGDGGLATSATLAFPSGLAFDNSGNLFIAARFNYRIRRVDASTGFVTTIAGTGIPSATGDGGLAIAANIGIPSGIAFDASGNIYIADENNHLIRRIDAATSIITTIAGTGVQGFNGDGVLATTAQLNIPRKLAIDNLGNLLIADSGNNRIRKIQLSNGIITTVAGTGVANFSGDNGLAVSAELLNPTGLAIDTSGNIFIADQGNHRIRRVDINTGIITTVAGAGGDTSTGDSGLAIAADIYPTDIVVDSAGNFFISDDGFNDQGSTRIRRVDASTSIINTIAGAGATGVGGDGGLATEANLDELLTVGALDASGNLLISTGHAVRQITFVNNPDVFPFDPAASIDTDGDGFPDSFNAGATTEQIAASSLIIDAFPNDPTAAIDDDSDGFPDHFIVGSGITEPPPLAEDLDDDNDGFSDLKEIIAGTDPLNPDSDADGVLDGIDVFPLDPNETIDTDNDGIGNNADLDDDNDTIPDVFEQLPNRNPLLADWMISAGGYHACALDDSGVQCWGKNDSGETIVPILANTKTVSAGRDHNCALDNNGVKCWGHDFFGQSTVPALSNPIVVSAGAGHSCALDDNGVKCWGDDFYGQSTVPSLTNPVAISAGGTHSCVIDDSGVVCWGLDFYGQSTPPTLLNPIAISTGFYHSCALDDSGVVCWGINNSGEIVVPALVNPVMVTAGLNHTCALDDTGVVCWGDNNSGQTTVPALANPVAVSAGYFYTCTLSDGGVKCWGDDANGQSTVPSLIFDKDLDGLLDNQEDVNRNGIVDIGETDPRSIDSDSDGLTDGDEVLTYGTNPLLVDTDMDGFSDADEISSGTDPLDPLSPPTAAIPVMSPFAYVMLCLMMIISVGYFAQRYDAKI